MITLHRTRAHRSTSLCVLLPPNTVYHSSESLARHLVLARRRLGIVARIVDLVRDFVVALFEASRVLSWLFKLTSLNVHERCE
jgi:hypothetical protein